MEICIYQKYIKNHSHPHKLQKAIKRVWGISVTWHHLFFFTKRQNQKGRGQGTMLNDEKSWGTAALTYS